MLILTQFSLRLARLSHDYQEYNMTTRRQVLASVLGIPSLAAITSRVFAAWPERTTSIVVPYPAGGSTDQVARIIANKVQESLGKPIIVENKPGGGALIGTRFVARAAPDGYTLLLGTIASHGIMPTLVPDPQYDAIKDFEPVALIGKIPNILVVNPQLPAQSFQEFLNLAKSQPGKLNIGVNGGGNSTQLSAELFRLKTGVSFTSVPYKGSAPALADLVGGQIDAMFDNLPSSLPFIQSGRLRALAVTTEQRSAVVPNIPTIAELSTGSNLADFNVASWFGVLAPAGTPAEVTRQLNAKINDALGSPQVISQLRSLGLTPASGSAADFGGFVASEIARWGDVIRAAGIKLE